MRFLVVALGVLAVAGDTYCAAFGGAVGGTVLRNGERRFAIRKPTAEGCP